MDDFEKQNAADWINVQKSIFNNLIPEQKEWTNKTEIVNILNIIGKVKDSNHMLFPTVGGLDLEGAKNSYEKDCIELNFGYTYIIKPSRLLFQSFKDRPEWNYFWLETSELAPSGVYENESEPFENEEVLELSPGHYVSMAYELTHEYNGEELPNSARIIIRCSKGKYLLVQKAGPYNDNPLTYNGLHVNMSHEEFYQFIKKVIEQ